MKHYLALLCGALMLAACSNTSAIKEAVKEGLIDPDSVQFGDIIEFTDPSGPHVACVMVNAKNRMGGYTGEKLMMLARSEEGDWTVLTTFPGLECETFVAKLKQMSSQPK